MKILARTYNFIIKGITRYLTILQETKDQNDFLKSLYIPLYFPKDIMRVVYIQIKKLKCQTLENKTLLWVNIYNIKV